MSATTTQLLSSGEFCKPRYDTTPIRSASANVSFYTNNSKVPNLSCDTLVANERYFTHPINLILFHLIIGDVIGRE